MNNLFDNDITKQLQDKISKDFIAGLYRAQSEGKKSLGIERIMLLDDTLSLDKNKKAEHLKQIFSELELG